MLYLPDSYARPSPLVWGKHKDPTHQLQKSPKTICPPPTVCPPQTVCPLQTVCQLHKISAKGRTAYKTKERGCVHTLSNDFILRHWFSLDVFTNENMVTQYSLPSLLLLYWFFERVIPGYIISTRSTNRNFLIHNSPVFSMGSRVVELSSSRAVEQ